MSEFKRSAERSIAAVVSAILVVCFAAMPAYGQDTIQIAVDGQLVQFAEAKPYIDENSRTMVPLYMIADPLELTVKWDGKARTAEFSRQYHNEKFQFYALDGDSSPDYYVSSQTITFAIGSKRAVVEYDLCRFGESEHKIIYSKDVIMDTTAIIKNSRTYAPARYLAEAFQCSVKWDSPSKTADIATAVPVMLKQEKGAQLAIDAQGYQVPEEFAVFARETIDLVNAERAARGIPVLRMDIAMMKAAQARAVESTTLFSHTRPGGLSCFSIFSEFGITYNEGGENLAYGYATPEELVAAWMDSPGHRGNILNPDYTATGVGCTTNPEGLYYCAQLFKAE